MLLFGLAMGILFVVTNSKEGKLVILEFLIFIPLLLSLIFRQAIINFLINKSRYPGVFYSVISKLGLAGQLDFTLPDEVLNEIYKPTYPTQQFLEDNKLKTAIGPRPLNKQLTPYVILAGIGLLYFLFTSKKLDGNIQLIMVLVTVALFVWQFYQSGKKKDDPEPILFFRDKYLELPLSRINWTDIYDWNFQEDDGANKTVLFINHYDADKNIQETTVKVLDINIDKIDFLMLMTHFKGKYGQEGEGR